MLNQLIGAQGPAYGANGTTFEYDPGGRMDRMTSPNGIRRWGRDGDDVIVETDGSGDVLGRYVYGPGDDEPLVWYDGPSTAAGDRRFLAQDERGSVVAVMDGAGGTVAINRYDDWGVPGQGNLGRFQYTGQRWVPELQAYDYKARIYSPLIGRFLQPDPIGYGDGLNLYGYVTNDPVNAKDPSGLCARAVSGCLGGDPYWGNVIGNSSSASNIPMHGPEQYSGMNGTPSTWAATLTLTSTLSTTGKPSKLDLSTSYTKAQTAGGFTHVDFYSLVASQNDGDNRDIVVSCDAVCKAAKMLPTNVQRFIDKNIIGFDCAFVNMGACSTSDYLTAAGILAIGSIGANTAVEGASKGFAKYGIGRAGQIRFYQDRLILRLDVNKPITHLNVEGNLFGISSIFTFQDGDCDD